MFFFEIYWLCSSLFLVAKIKQQMWEDSSSKEEWQSILNDSQTYFLFPFLLLDVGILNCSLLWLGSVSICSGGRVAV